MNNKKLIIIIAAAVAAIAAIIVAIVLIGGSISGQRPDEPDTSSASSITSGSGTSSGSSTNTSSATSSVIEEGKVGIGKVEGTTGKTVEVPITISKNPGIVAGQLYVKYDTSALSYLGYEDRTMNVEEISAIDNEIRCVIFSPEMDDSHENGNLIVLKFKINDNAKSGEYNIEVIKNEFCNFEETLVYPTITNGKITVK